MGFFTSYERPKANSIMNADVLTSTPLYCWRGVPTLRNGLIFHPEHLVAGGHQKAEAAARCQINATQDGLSLMFEGQ